jgi:hypothetical protein
MKNTIANSESTSRRNFIKNASYAAAGFYMAPSYYKNNGLKMPPIEVTRYGCLFQNLSTEESEEKMQTAGFDFVRVPLVLTETTSKNSIDKFLSDGFSVQINLNWQPTRTPSDFPKPEDYPKAIELATEFFEKHKSYKDQIPLICLGNEWDNINYHSNSIIYYLNGLKLIVDLAHTYNFKVSDAGISSTSLERWMYSQLSGPEALLWKKDHWVGETNPNYQPLIKRIEFYINQIKKIPIDYLNVHWYNKEKATNDFPKAAGTYLKRCEKTEIITNEFGVKKTTDFDTWQKTVDEVSTFQTDEGDKITKFALAFSGTGQEDKAINLTDDKLKLLANPVSSNFIS